MNSQEVYEPPLISVVAELETDGLQKYLHQMYVFITRHDRVLSSVMEEIHSLKAAQEVILKKVEMGLVTIEETTASLSKEVQIMQKKWPNLTTTDHVSKLVTNVMDSVKDLQHRMDDVESGGKEEIKKSLDTVVSLKMAVMSEKVREKMADMSDRVERVAGDQVAAIREAREDTESVRAELHAAKIEIARDVDRAMTEQSKKLMERKKSFVPFGTLSGRGLDMHRPSDGGAVKVSAVVFVPPPETPLTPSVVAPAFRSPSIATTFAGIPAEDVYQEFYEQIAELNVQLAATAERLAEVNIAMCAATGDLENRVTANYAELESRFEKTYFVLGADMQKGMHFPKKTERTALVEYWQNTVVGEAAVMALKPITERKLEEEQVMAMMRAFTVKNVDPQMKRFREDISVLFSTFATLDLLAGMAQKKDLELKADKHQLSKLFEYMNDLMMTLRKDVDHANGVKPTDSKGKGGPAGWGAIKEMLR